MSYEKGDKFVLEIDEVIEVEGVKNRYYRCKNSEIIFNEHELKRLIGISETPEKAYNRGYYDGSHKGFNLTKDEIEKARAEGAEEACAFRNRAMQEPTSEEFRWYSAEPKSFLQMAYAEAKEDFEKWKKGTQKWEPKVGDIVEWDDEQGIILEVTTHQNAYVLWLNDGVDLCHIEDMTPTGRHVDLSNVLKVLEEVEHE